jgi:DNA polymerase-3 subunit alpha
LANQAKALNMPAIALTDHNNLFNAMPFYKACKKAGVKPILGVELNFVEDCKESIQLKTKNVYHIVLLAETDEGWRNIVKMVSLANDEQHFYYSPRIDFETLAAHKEGVILLTSCHDGILASHLKSVDGGEITNTFKAEAIVRKLLTIFDRNHFYVEVQDANEPAYKVINTALRKVAFKYGVRTVATNDVHYTHAKDAEAHKALRKMSEFQYNKVSGSTFNTDEYFIKSRTEMDALTFSEDEKNITLDIADRCNVTINFSEKRLPSYGFLQPGKTAMQQLREVVNENTTDWNAEYKQRIERELKDIETLGFADYFLIVADVVSWAKTQNILVGPGRGSAGGSLVSYALGITNIDPMKYGLIWERFLNVGRKSLPDIDTDFPRSKRGLVIDYIRSRFGATKVAQLATFNKLAARAVLKEVFKIYGMSFDDANAITSLVPLKNDEHTQVTLDEAIEMVPELQAYEAKYKAWFAVARSLEGCYKSLGTHAAAVVISNKDFSAGEYPLCRSSDSKSLIFAWDMQTVDDLGLLKLDVLGLSTLDVINETIALVNRRHKLNLTLDTIPLDDSKTFDLMAEGKTVGVFQLEKQLGKTWSKQLAPRSIEEISDLVSLIRPGPMESKMHEMYRDVKSGERMPDYVHKSLKPILDPTYGALLYQEQVIEICKVLAGMSLIDADLVRKAMGKKKPEEMRKWQETFVNGCKANGIPEDAATEIWSYIDKFSGYGFNKSHGIGYALLAYYTAYLKANFTVEFICANLKNSQWAQDTMEEINQFVHDAKLFKIEVTPPRIELGNSDFDIVDDHKIAFGLSFLKGAGDKGIDAARQAYLTMTKPDFNGFVRTAYDVGVNRRVMEALIYGGALDSFGMSRNQMFAHFDLYESLTDNERKIVQDHSEHNWVGIIRALSDDKRSQLMKEQWQVKIPNVRRRETIGEYLNAFDGVDAFDSFVSKIAWEKEFLGISLSGDETNLFTSKHKCSDIINFGGEDMPIEVIVRIEGIKKHMTKSKEEMAFLTVADNTGKLDNFVVFPRAWEYAKNAIIVGNIARIFGKVDRRGSVLVNRMERVR